MADQSEPYDSPPVLPSIRPADHLECEGKRINRKLEQLGEELSRIDLCSGVIAQLMVRLNITTFVIDSFTLETGPRAEIKPNKVIDKTVQDKKYYVNFKPGRSGS